MAHIRLVHTSEHEDILVAEGMRGADDTFNPGLKEVGKRFGVSIEYLPESGFSMEYTVQPPVPTDRVQAFAELVTSVAVDSIRGPYPTVTFGHQPAITHPERIITSSLALIS